MYLHLEPFLPHLMVFGVSQRVAGGCWCCGEPCSCDFKTRNSWACHHFQPASATTFPLTVNTPQPPWINIPYKRTYLLGTISNIRGLGVFENRRNRLLIRDIELLQIGLSTFLNRACADHMHVPPTKQESERERSACTQSGHGHFCHYTRPPSA